MNFDLLFSILGVGTVVCPAALLAVVGLTTRRDEDAGVAAIVPPAPVVPAISRGATRTPSFAIVAKTEAICTVLTE